MIILFIDDEESRHILVESILGKEHELLHAYSYDEAIQIFESSAKTIGLAMFDHDLGDLRDEDGDTVDYNGSKVADYIGYTLIKSKYPTRAIVHSHNESGALNIASKLRCIGIFTEVIRYSGIMIENLKKSLAPQ